MPATGSATGLAARWNRPPPPWSPGGAASTAGAGRIGSDELIDRFVPRLPGTARAAYLADLREFRALCARVGIGLLGVRSHIEAYTSQLEQAGRSRATVARRLATLAGRLLPLGGPGGSAPPLPRHPRSSPLGSARFADARA